jgi:hypothetical protein
MGLTNYLKGQKSLFIVMAKDIICALTTSNKINNNKQVVRILSVDCKNIKNTIER